MKILLFLAVFTFSFAFSFDSYSQSVAKDEQNPKFNLPPGAKLMHKVDTEIDYSYKLNEIPASAPLKFIPGNFLKEFREDDLLEMKTNTPETYEYYTKAADYYNNLSNKVKATFTIEEIWYIYKFDQNFKANLLNY